MRHFAIPLVACVWSCGDLDASSYPARHLFRFLDHHGMLTVTGSPTWRTVTGGSATYVDRLVARLPDVRKESPVTAVTRHDDGVDVLVRDGQTATFDRAVIATHADQALDLLADATPDEKRDLSAIRYSRNETWLHRDSSVLPKPQEAKASWNYRMHACDAPAPDVTVSYWMNRLHGITDADDHVVTLNPAGTVDESLVTARMSYDHPIFTQEAVEAAGRLRERGRRPPRLRRRAPRLGLPRGRLPLRRGRRRVLRGALVTAVLTPPQVPALVDGTVAHSRRTPLHHSFTYGHYQWLVDIDDAAPTSLAGKAARSLRRTRPPRRRHAGRRHPR